MIDCIKKLKEKEKDSIFVGVGSPPGSGKSTILLFIVYVSRKLGYEVFYIPNGRQYAVEDLDENMMDSFAMFSSHLLQYNQSLLDATGQTNHVETFPRNGTIQQQETHFLHTLFGLRRQKSNFLLFVVDQYNAFYEFTNRFTKQFYK